MILVTGASGQLGSDVISELKKREIQCLGTDIADMDITNCTAVNSFINELKPDCVIHCAAYTAVDKAEDEADLCMKINVQGTENIAKACKENSAAMIYISTDYVFPGDGDKPYEVNDPKGPLSVYGKSKLAGEDAVKKYLDMYYIVRISWVFGSSGNNFVKTMLRLAETKDELNVVCDQIGSPTYTADLAILLADMALSGKYGEYHATNEGYCSWAEFASEIMRLAQKDCKINPIPTAEYPTRAVRPHNSRMSKASLDGAGLKKLPHWNDALKRFVPLLNK